MGPLEQLFERWAGEPCLECLALSASGSSRRYFRLRGATHSCIGTEASDVRENEAFFAFSRHFGAKQMPVPELYAVADDRKHYLQQEESPLRQYADHDHQEFIISTQNYATFYNRKNPAAYEAYFKK